MKTNTEIEMKIIRKQLRKHSLSEAEKTQLRDTLEQLKVEAKKEKVT